MKDNLEFENQIKKLLFENIRKHKYYYKVNGRAYFLNKFDKKPIERSKITHYNLAYKDIILNDGFGLLYQIDTNNGKNFYYFETNINTLNPNDYMHDEDYVIFMITLQSWFEDRIETTSNKKSKEFLKNIIESNQNLKYEYMKAKIKD